MIPVEIKGQKDLISSLRLMGKGEILDGDNKYYCEKCKEKVSFFICNKIIIYIFVQVRSVKRTLFHSLPNTLIFHLHRFEFDYDTGRRTKINDRFEFPVDQVLDLKPLMRETFAQRENPMESTTILEIEQERCVEFNQGAIKVKEYIEEAKSPPTCSNNVGVNDHLLMTPVASHTNTPVGSPSTSSLTSSSSSSPSVKQISSISKVQPKASPPPSSLSKESKSEVKVPSLSTPDSDKIEKQEKPEKIEKSIDSPKNSDSSRQKKKEIKVSAEVSTPKKNDLKINKTVENSSTKKQSKEFKPEIGTPVVKKFLQSSDVKLSGGLNSPLSPSTDSAVIVHRPPQYYQYKLAGIIMHSGSAESGHYYSYIQERTGKFVHKRPVSQVPISSLFPPTSSGGVLRSISPSSVQAVNHPAPHWISFNDDVVTQYDPTLIDKNCFGTTPKENEKKSTSSRCAYLLVYDRYINFYCIANFFFLSQIDYFYFNIYYCEELTHSLIKDLLSKIFHFLI
jgi:hypothetical protein